MNYDDRLHHTLKLAEERFGGRVGTDAIPPITFHDGPPQVFFPAHGKIAIRLSLRCQSDYLLGCYQLAHETVHLLSTVDGRTTTTLEEGVAVMFSRNYIRDNIDIEFPLPVEARYRDAFTLVDRFLSPRPDAILRLREHEPIISSISADLIRKLYPEVAPPLCWSLVTPFCGLA